MPIMGLFGILFALVIGVLVFTALVPLLLVVLALAAFGATDWQVWRPDVLWTRLTNQQVKRNAALLHATLTLLNSKSVGATRGLPEGDGFFVEGSLSSPLVWDAALEGLSRLRRGEVNLAWNGTCRHSVALGTILLALTFASLLALSSTLSVMTTLLCVIAARALAPVIAPWIQKYFMTDSDVRGLQLQGISERQINQSALGGRLAWRSEGFFIATTFEGTPVEVEIIE